MGPSVEQIVMYLEEVLGDYRKESRSQYLFYCPKCKHRKAKLAVNIKKLLFKCWVCEYSGSLKFLVSRTKKDKLQGWNDLIGVRTEIDVPERELKFVTLPNEFKRFGNKYDSEGKKALLYLLKRGITRYDIARYNIGYATQSRYRGRIIIPSYDNRGKLNFFIGRAFHDWMEQRYRNEYADKTRIIFNDLFVDWSKPVIITEGVFDSMIAGANAVPLLGSSLNKESLLFNKLCTLKPDVYVALDTETEKDREKTIRIMKTLFNNGIVVNFVDVAPYEDAAQCGKKIFREKIKEAVRIEESDQLFEIEMRLT